LPTANGKVPAKAPILAPPPEHTDGVMSGLTASRPKHAFSPSSMVRPRAQAQPLSSSRYYKACDEMAVGGREAGDSSGILPRMVSGFGVRKMAGDPRASSCLLVHPHHPA
jgi:hypothetical protein